MKYRLISKPVEAYQYTGHNAEEFVDRFGVEVFDDGTLGVCLSLRTIPVLMEPGDWLLIDSERKLSLVSDANFKSRYEPAE
jgi:hypothetical protein